MKKNIILYLALVLTLVFQFNIDTYADTGTGRVDTTTPEEPSYGGDNGTFSSGYFSFSAEFPAREYYKEYQYNVVTGNKLYLTVKDDTNANTRITELKETYDNGYSFDKGSSAIFTYVERAIADHYYNGETEYNNPQVITGSLMYGEHIKHYSNNFVQDHAFYTNLPVFWINDTDGINAYLSSGDYSAALNYNQIKPKHIVPPPYFDKITGLDDSSKRQSMIGGFSQPLIFRWTPGDNENFDYNSMGYEGRLTVYVTYIDQGILSDSSFVENISYRTYPGDKPYYMFATEQLNKKLFTAFGTNFFSSMGGKIVRAVFEINNVDRNDHSNISAPVYYSYNFVDGTSGTNNETNDNNYNPDTNDNVSEYNPNVNQGGNGDVPSGSSNSTSSATANGVVVNVTQNNNNNKSSVWDTLINALTLLTTVFSNKIGGVFDSIADFFAHLSNITDSTGVLSKLIENLSTYLVGTNSGSGSGSGSSGGLSGLAGTIENITGSINTLISGVLTPFTNAVTSLMSSVTDLLDASSTLGQYITSGFGLLGDNGYISLFAAFFQFVPTEIWSIIKLAVGSSASVLLSGSVVKLLRRY